MAFEIKGLLSTELNDRQFEQLSGAFNQVFEKDYTPDHFKKKYFNTHLGFSFHGVLFFDGMIVGSFTVIPREYYVGQQKRTLGLACDAFILKDHRKDELFLLKMHKAVEAIIKPFNISFIFSLPNNIAYPYWKHIARYKDIGSLNYYVLPLSLKPFFPKLQFLDFIFKTGVRSWTMIRRSGNDPLYNGSETKLIKDNDFSRYRYSSGDYTNIDTGKGQGWYRIVNEDGIRVAYIIDISPATNYNIKYVVKKIMQQVQQKTDLIMFIGNWRKAAGGLIKLPRKKEPRKQRFIGWSADPGNDGNLFEISNWQISLADFDNR